MAISLNEYIAHCRQKTNDTRVVVFPNTDIGTRLIGFHFGQKHKEIVVGELIDNTSGILPMPGKIMQAIQETINKSATHCYVTGIDAYLLLLEASKADEFFTALLALVDGGKANATFILNSNHNLKPVFSNPKYRDGMQLIYLEGMSDSFIMPNITLIPARWRSKNSFDGFKGFLSHLHTGFMIPSGGDFTVAIQNYKSKIAGLSAHILQILSPIEFLKKQYGFDAKISEKVAIDLLSKKGNPDDELVKGFIETNINVRYAVKRLLEMDEALWPAYVWMLKKRIAPTSYLYKVLLTNPEKNTLLSSYVVECAINLIGEPKSKEYAKERADALQYIGEDANLLISVFVSELKTNKNDADVLPWLNAGTDPEKEEIVRRASISDLTIGLHKMYADVLPDLSNYLSDEFLFSEQSLTDYFRTYRRFKLQNNVTLEFAELAFNSMIPSTVKGRDDALKNFVADADTALLVVDGMGAEYLPLIYSVAKRKGLVPFLTSVVYAKIPTSTTPYNNITWPKERRLLEIKEVDNIAHVGAAKYEKNTFERNIIAALKVLTGDLFRRIANALKDYKRVIVTADHGSTRLGVLAHNSGIGKTIDCIANPLDWRFCKAIPGQQRPTELTATLDGYWVVKGYNRLSYSGGKLNEMHGGATLEEQLVPLVIFEKGSLPATINITETKSAAQLVEKDDFDI